MGSKHRRLLFGLWLCCSVSHAAQTVPLITYYTSLPYAVKGVAAEQSYTVQLARWLSEQSAGRYLFEAQQIPKLRVVRMMQEPSFLGVVAWGNPLWLDDAQQQRYLWSAPYMRDSDLRVSRQADKVLFAQGHPVHSARFGGISGHFYASLQDDFANGLLTRDDAQNDLSSLLMLQYKRVDVILLQASSLTYLRTQVANFDTWAFVDAQPQAEFERYLFTSRNAPELMQFLDQAMQGFAQSPVGRQVLLAPSP
jgi:hypothetical protein